MNALVLLHVGAAATADAATFYVRTNGNDANDGRTPATAFASVEQAGRALLNAGDRVVVGPGTYSVANVVAVRNGVAGRPIVFHGDLLGSETGDSPGPVILTVRTGSGELNSAFLLYARRHVVIEGFTIRGASDPGIQVRPDPVSHAPSSHIVLRNNILQNGAKTGVEIEAIGTLTIQDNAITGHGGSGIAIHGGFAAAVSIDRNVIGENTANGIALASVGSALVTGNQLVANGSGGVIVRHRGSLFPGSQAPSQGTGSVAGTIRIAGNTMRQSGGYGLSLGLAAEPLEQPVEVVDNVFGGNNSGGATLFNTAATWVTACNATGNGGSGISVQQSGGSAAVEIARNVANGNGAHGIFATGAAGLRLDRNTTENNLLNGILVRGSDQVVATGNTSRNNPDGGIVIGSGAGLVGDCDRDGVVLARDLAAGIAIVLAQRSATTCSFLNADDDPVLDVADLIAQVNQASSGTRAPEVGRAAEVTANVVAGSAKLGVAVTARDSLHVEDNDIQQSQAAGIYVASDGDILVQDNEVRQSGTDGILVSGGTSASLQGNQIDASTASGLRLVLAGDVLVEANTVVGSGERGISIDALGTAVVASNDVGQQGSVGIVVSASGDLQVDDNRVLDNGSVGISVAADLWTPIALRDNRVERSGMDGILVSGGRQLVAEANQVVTSGDNGLRLRVAGGLTARRNVITSSGRSAIVAEAEGEVVADDNRLTTSGQVGLSLQAPAGKSMQAYVRRNQVRASTLGGIFVERAGAAILSGNQLENPGTSGITLLRSGRMELEANHITDTDGHGLLAGSELEPALSLRLIGNRVERSRQTGMNLWGVENMHLLENRVFDSGTVGIAIRVPGMAATGTLIGNTVARNPVDGINVFGLQGATIQNNILFSNGEAGLVLRGAPNARIINNLIYANARFGVAIGTGDTATIASPAPLLASNTFYRNGQFGVVIGTADVGPEQQPLPQSPGALIVNNAFEGNGFDAIDNNGGGIGVARGSLGRMVVAFNFNPDSYGDGIRVSPYDQRVAPGFVDPDGADDVLGGHGYEDDDFHLRADPVEQRSAAVDAGSGEASDIGVTGSCVAGAAVDRGTVDVCFHYGADADQVVHVAIPDLPQFTFVRANGSADNDGLSPQNAFASLYDAGLKATSGTTIVIGPGTYREGDIRVRLNVSDVTFLADPSGSLTGDPPGPVLIDAAGCERCLPSSSGTTCLPCDDTGFVLVDAPDTTIDGFHITGARQAGIQVRRGSGGSVIRNNVVFSNALRGIESLVGGSPSALDQPIDGVSFINNLVYANGSGGIRVSETINAVVQNNTVYGNGIATAMSTAIFVGNPSSPIPTRGVVVQRNIVQANHDVGILVDSRAREGYVTGFNVALGLINPLLAYAGNTPRADSDHLGDALLVNPAGVDGTLGGAGFADDDFRLQQGGVVVSPAVDIDFGDLDSLIHGTTASSGVPDRGPADAGYHYPLPESLQGVTP